MNAQPCTSSATSSHSLLTLHPHDLPQAFDNRDSIAEPPFYAKQSVIHGLGVALIIGAAVGLAAAGAAALWLVGTPIFVITSVAVGVVTSLAMLVAGIVLRLKSEFWQDPDYRQQIAAEIVDTVQRERLGFLQLKTRFARAMAENIFSNAQLNDLYRQDIAQLSYIDFIRRHGEDFLAELSAPSRDVMRAKFTAFVAQAELGIQALSRQFAKTIALLNVSTEDLISHALFQQMDDLQCRDLTYKQFLQNNGQRAIETFIRINTAVLPPIRESFLNMGWQDMTAPSFSQDRLLLGIEESDIQTSVKRDSHHPYFTFKQKHTIAPLQQGIIAKEEFPCSWKEELVAYLERQSAASILAHAADLNLFDLDSHALLFQRWQKTPLSEIFAEDRTEFAALYLTTPQGRADAIHRLLQEAEASNWQVQQLLQFRELWGRELLTPETCFEDGSSIQERFDTEIETIGTFEQLIEAYGSMAFEQRLCFSPAVEKLVWQMHRAHPLENLSEKAARIFHLFPKAMPEALQKILQNGKRQQMAALAAFREATEQLKQDLSHQLATHANRLKQTKATIANQQHPIFLQCERLRAEQQRLRCLKSAREAQLTQLQNALFFKEQAETLRNRHATRFHVTMADSTAADLNRLETNLEHAKSTHASLAASKVQGFAEALRHSRRVDAARQEVEALQREIQKFKHSERSAPIQLAQAQVEQKSQAAKAEIEALPSQISAATRALQHVSNQLQTLEANLAAKESYFRTETRHLNKMAENACEQACEIAKSASERAQREAKDRFRRAEWQIRESFIQALDALQASTIPSL